MRALLMLLLVGFALVGAAAAPTCCTTGDQSPLTVSAGCLDGSCAATEASVAPNFDVCVTGEHAAATHFMSLAGFLRWQHFQETGSWLSIAQAETQAHRELQYCKLPAR